MNVIRRLLPTASRCSNAQYLLLCKPFHPNTPITSFLRPFSTNGGNKNDPPPNDDIWNLSHTTFADFDCVFNSDPGAGNADTSSKNENLISDDSLREDILRTWNLSEVKDDTLLDIDEPQQEEEKTPEEIAALEREEQELLPTLKGPNRAFGDLIAAAGITDEMLDSLIALKDFEGVQGLPPLSEIEELRYEKSTKKSIRAEMERQKLEEAAKARVKKVDADGKAYGTGRRKCSIARVWIEPGDGKFVINDKSFDVYLPMLDHRAALLLPFSETKTLGLWDVRCHVKGGGVSGQVGAIQLGISRALQNFEPELRPPLRSGGYLTRDPRVVERKKPGKAKARKSFQWVKR